MSSPSCATRAPRCCWSSSCWKRRSPPPTASTRWCRDTSCWKRQPARPTGRSGSSAPISGTTAMPRSLGERRRSSCGKPPVLKVLLTHTPEFRRQYYGERSLKVLQAAAQVVLHEADDALDAAGLIGAAGDVDIIVADRLTEAPGEIFPRLPKLRAFVRCAVDIRNIDVEAASAAGVLITR